MTLSDPTAGAVAPRGVGCIAGPLPGGAIGGALGPAPGGPFEELACLEIRDDAGVARSGEIAFAGIPLPEGLGLLDPDDLVVVGPGDQRLAAQFDVLSRWAGVVDDPTRPIRWLRVAVPAEVAADGFARYALRRYDAPGAAADPWAASITFDDPTWRVETGLATFVLDPVSGAVLQSVDVDLDDDAAGGKTRVYDHLPGAGPRLVFDPDENPGNGNDVTLDTSAAGEVVVDPGGFEVVHAGPVHVQVAVRGHFVDAGGASECAAAGPGAEYEALGFTAVMTFTRASRDVRLQFQLRNECSDAFGGNWTDDTLMVREASWELPFALTSQTAWVGGDAALAASVAGFGGVSEVEQRRGTGSPTLFQDWVRRARVRRDAAELEAGEAFADPMVALSDPTLTVAAQMPWMRFREPQALRATGDDLSLRFVSESLRVGEGKGIWNFARIHLLPTGLARGGVGPALEGLRAAGRAELERGLLLWPGRAAVNAAEVLPSLGTGEVHTARTHTEEWLEVLHAETVGPGGQWDRNKTFGSQYWPETGSNDPFSVDADFPNQSTAGSNYWDPAGIELHQFLATGEPRWAWDFAVPGYWVQAFLAYLNTGENFFGNRNGLAVESGGPGCRPLVGDPPPEPFVEPCTDDGTGGGHWHRSGGGSDDYTYAMSIELGYALRPNLPLRDRFGQAGRTVLDRYDPAIPEIDREAFVNAINVTRQVVQHLEMLANCAEFVPGARGQACQDRLHGILAELAAENLAGGIPCAGEIDFGAGENGDFTAPPTQCYTPQQFMTNALIHPFFHRYWSNYRHAADAGVQTAVAAVRRMLVEFPRALVTGGPGATGPPPIEQDVDGNLVPFGDWGSIMDCEFDAGGTTLVRCETAVDGEPLFMFTHNQPHTIALLLMAHAIDPSVDLCEVSRTAYDDPAFTGSPTGMPDGAFGQVGHFDQAGWWKGSSQIFQGMHAGIGLYDVCDVGIFADGFEAGDVSAWGTP